MRLSFANATQDEKLIQQIAEAFVEICKLHPSYFGLRDYYCLLQKLSFIKDKEIKLSKVSYLIQRDFGKFFIARSFLI